MRHAGAPGFEPVLARTSALLCLVVAAVLWLGPSLVRDDLFSDDAAHHIYWLYQFADPDLFSDDLSVDYFSSPSVAPRGYTAIYAAIAPFMDVLFASQVVAVLLLAAMAWFAWLLGKAAFPERPFLAGMLAVVAAMALLSRIDLLPSVGFQRTFAMPLTLMCLWALVAGRYQWVGISWLIAALIYPVIVPVLGLAAGFVFLIDLVRDRRMPDWWWWNGLLGIAAIGVVLLGRGVPEHVGPMVSYAQATQMAEFGPGGRQQLFGSGWTSYWFGHHRTGLGVRPKILLAAGLAGLLALALRGRRAIPMPAIVMAGTGIGLWFAARMTLFDLYLPNRHSRWTVAAVIVVVLAVVSAAVISRLQAILRDQGAAPTWALPALAAVAAPLVVGLALLPSAAAAWRSPVDTDLERAYAFIAELPKDTLVAAHPDLADFVPVRTRRSVLASTEISIAFMQGYYQALVPRIEASLRAAYATDWQELDGLLEPFGVGVVLTHPSVWESEGYPPPFEELATELMQPGRKEAFVLRNPPPERILFQSGETFVVRVGGKTPGTHD
jgi:hypothetical protein